MDVDRERYCRDVETYLCRKNEGHLIRVVGPSFEIVSSWAARGVPFKVACAGIDRYFERYYLKRVRRRPIKIDFCDADVLDAFDEWRRAVGVPVTDDSAAEEPAPGGRPRQGLSLPAHLERAVLWLTRARTNGTLGAAFDDLIDRIAHELDRARADARGIRGDARDMLLTRLAALDAELLRAARATLDEPARAMVARDAQDELAGFRGRMSDDAFARACDAAIDRLVRERFALPVVTFF